MESLPPELKQNVCSFLSPKQLKPLRLVSKIFAAAAATHFIVPRIFLFNHPDSVSEVERIIDHPEHSKRVTTIIIDPTPIYEARDYDDWVRHLPTDWHVPRWEVFAPPPPTRYNGRKDALNLMSMVIDAKNKHAEAFYAAKHSEREVRNLWHVHEALQSYQARTYLSAVIHETLQLAFMCCPKLRHIVVTSEHAPKSAGSKKKDSIFKDVVLVTHPAQFYYRLCLDDILPIKKFVESSPVATLTICNTALDDWTHGIAGRHLMLENLEHLRISISTPLPLDFVGLVKAARRLKTLWLRIDTCDDIRGWDNFLQYTHLEHLEEVLFDSVWFEEPDYLVDFLLRHADSLRSLALRQVYVTGGEWLQVLRRLSCKLPKLKKLSLDLLEETDEFVYKDSFMINAESFLLHGGPEPVQKFICDYDECGEDLEEDEDEIDELGDEGHCNDYSPHKAPSIHMELKDGLCEDYEQLVNPYFVGGQQLMTRWTKKAEVEGH